MITNLPLYVYFIFAMAVIFTLGMFYYATKKNAKIIFAFVTWGTLHSLIAISGFYDNTMTIPPRFIMVVIPVFIIIISSIFSNKMQTFLGTFNLKWLTFIHTVRIPVEFVLLWLFIAGYAPELVSFEGKNFDILIGITAPIVGFFAFRKDKINKSLLLVWNVGSLLLLLNIIVLAIFSLPTVIQQFAFDQPNIALIKFPFILLPAIIVPIVMMSIMAIFVILKRVK